MSSYLSYENSHYMHKKNVLILSLWPYALKAASSLVSILALLDITHPRSFVMDHSILTLPRDRLREAARKAVILCGNTLEACMIETLWGYSYRISFFSNWRWYMKIIKSINEICASVEWPWSEISSLLTARSGGSISTVVVANRLWLIARYRY